MTTMSVLTQQQASAGSSSPAVVSSHQPYFPSEADWKMMLNWGESALRSGMLPSGIKSREAAAIIALKGRELGIPFMVAIAHIHVISGKPSMSAEMMQTLARKNLPGLVINIIKSTAEEAELEFIRPERGAKPYRSIFTLADAKRANLLNKDVWKLYPAAMLWSRAISAGLRKVCPEALMGVSYTPEELNADVDSEGNVIETTGKHIPEQPQPQQQPEAPAETTVTTVHDFSSPEVSTSTLMTPEREVQGVVTADAGVKVTAWKFSGPAMKILVDVAQKSGWAMPHVFNYVKKHYPESGGYQGLTKAEFDELCNHIAKNPVGVK